MPNVRDASRPRAKVESVAKEFLLSSKEVFGSTNGFSAVRIVVVIVAMMVITGSSSSSFLGKEAVFEVDDRRQLCFVVTSQTTLSLRYKPTITTRARFPYTGHAIKNVIN